VIVSLKLVQEMEEQVKQVRQRLKEAHDRQKSYANSHRIDHSYEAGDQVFIRIQPNKSTIQFGKGMKLSPRFVGPFRIKENIGPVAYHLVLPPHLHKTHDVFMCLFYDIMFLMILTNWIGRTCRSRTWKL